MCLLLYLATAAPLAAPPSGGLAIESVPADVLARLRDKLTLPHVCAVLAGTCSCAFPQSGAGPLEWDDWMAEHQSAAERDAEVANLRALLALVRAALDGADTVELYPVWNNDEDKRSEGRIEARLADLRPERFLFAERWVYAVRA